jgi:hypothetical protein
MSTIRKPVLLGPTGCRTGMGTSAQAAGSVGAFAQTSSSITFPFAGKAGLSGTGRSPGMRTAGAPKDSGRTELVSKTRRPARGAGGGSPSGKVRCGGWETAGSGGSSVSRRKASSVSRLYPSWCSREQNSRSVSSFSRPRAFPQYRHRISTQISIGRTPGRT